MLELREFGSHDPGEVGLVDLGGAGRIGNRGTPGKERLRGILKTMTKE